MDIVMDNEGRPWLPYPELNLPTGQSDDRAWTHNQEFLSLRRSVLDGNFHRTHSLGDDIELR
jgi:hypothetical protein